MKRSFLFLAAIILSGVAYADSRIWPPSPYSIMSNQGVTVMRFTPKIKGSDVVATHVQSFTFDEKTARYALALDRELTGFWEPTFAFAAKNPNVLIFIFCRPDMAFAVVDTSSGKIVVSKTFQELVPEYLDYRDRSTSTLQWCRQPFTSEGKLYLPGGILSGEDAKRGPSFVVDLATCQVTREKE